jgi:hypothetical protein
VQDIPHSRGPGLWERTAGRFTKIRIDPDTLMGMLNGAGFGLEYSAMDNGMITVIARKGA